MRDSLWNLNTFPTGTHHVRLLFCPLHWREKRNLHFSYQKWQEWYQEHQWDDHKQQPSFWKRNSRLWYTPPPAHPAQCSLGPSGPWTCILSTTSITRLPGSFLVPESGFWSCTTIMNYSEISVIWPQSPSVWGSPNSHADLFSLDFQSCSSKDKRTCTQWRSQHTHGSVLSFLSGWLRPGVTKGQCPDLQETQQGRLQFSCAPKTVQFVGLPFAKKIWHRANI